VPEPGEDDTERGYVDDTARGVAFMFGASAVLSFQDVLGKSLTGSYPVIEILAVRAFVAATVVLVTVHVRWGLASLRTDQLWAHAFRSACMLGAFLLYFQALKDLPLADATAIFFGAPLFMAVLARVLLREHLSLSRIGVLLLGFVGVLIVVHPTTDGVQPAALLVLAGSILYPLAMITTRSLSRHDPAHSMLAWTLVIQAFVAGTGAAFTWETPSVPAWGKMAAMGLLTILGHAGLILAFSKARVAVLAPVEYVALVFAAIFGFVVWGDVPQLAFWIGAPLIVASSILGTLVDRPPTRQLHDDVPAVPGVVG
jgi:drug/metabolite transporter (DMT)-like permease